ncbi:hypothetical protein NPX13_g549 [Xylaria arbuscula]|uniref:Heterokaryon incompatibility domain-containing protein n=1 Tax=Xylaria arbuscula TaxID=114810 RepID=A0A9W8TSE0_9PEZI|nr:hypothetical protein NPX13_g549 [Xylaria arbuscula]
MAESPRSISNSLQQLIAHIRGGCLMESLMSSRVMKSFLLKSKQLISVFHISDREVERNPPSENLPPLRNPPAENLPPPRDSADRLIPAQDLAQNPADSFVPHGDPPSNYTPHQDPLTTSEENEVAKVRSTLLRLRSNNEELQRELGDVCHVVVGMLQDLCQRDNRFLYLQEAMTEFLDGDLGLRDRLSRRNQHIDSALAADGGDGKRAIFMKLEFLIQNKSIPEKDLNARFDFQLAAFEILSSVIYEILDVFNFDITVEESTVKHEISAYLGLLHRVYNRTKDSEPNPREPATHASEFSSQFNSKFTYQSKLDPATDQIRVVELSPGSEDDNIECRLRVHSIKEDGIPEALSYVWGKEVSQEPILVDLQPFSVTKNLLESLRGLRHPINSRTIWIDAICINQGDYKERNHQVRLMRNIYSQAEKTIIYLTKSDVHFKLKQGEQLAPLPTAFGGFTMNEFDLTTILHEFERYSIDSPWSEKQLALYLMLVRCIQHMLSHAWWERIWTLQEGALPESPPIVYYQGYSCTLQTVQSAFNIVKQVAQWSSSEKRRITHASLDNPSRIPDPRTNEVLDVLQLTVSQGLGFIGQPLLFRLRQSSKQEAGVATGFLSELLNGTGGYRATDPRDKIYALESLLPRCIGKLMRIDYSEDYKTIFTYATARSINTLRTYHIAALCSLLIESNTPRSHENYAETIGETASHPSWVLDFSYCDAGEYTNAIATYATDVVTLDGFLMHNGRKIADSLGGTLNPMFATPSTLFCHGMNIDGIHEAGVIGNGNISDLIVAVISLVVQIKQRLENLQASSPTGVEAQGDIDLDATSSLMAFFCLYLTTDAFPEGEGEDFFATRLKETAGKTYFITENGLVGIATAPVRQGDSLCLLDGVPVYFVLRPVPDSTAEGQGQDNNGSEAAQRHRIVARAAVKGVDLATLRATSPNCRFQIV